MPGFSANLGFLWNELPLPDAVRAAKSAGFEAVELHWPYDTPVDDMAAALRESDLPLLGLNTLRGAPGENGLAALPGREGEACAAIDQALEYGAALGAENVHVMAGFTEGDSAHRTFVANLRYACAEAAKRDMSILIEPLNSVDAPGYFLGSTGQASDLISEVGAPNIALMFDFYHVQIIEGDVTRRFAEHLPIIGHVQIAAVPDRGEPDAGELNYAFVYETLARLGYDEPIGAEYKPRGAGVEAGLGWLAAAKAMT